MNTQAQSSVPSALDPATKTDTTSLTWKADPAVRASTEGAAGLVGGAGADFN
ncbi:MAG TPA: hypothetical protein VNT26_15870 [Candidatus Sulfotelmatobacter sp.]|nr:hypothetical protein [Candidatus Sulfotelmatobacter sp.]HWI57536.1 hypothetical protein [Bacillota bacterium]